MNVTEQTQPPVGLAGNTPSRTDGTDPRATATTGNVEVDDTAHRLRRLEELLSATAQNVKFSTPHHDVAIAKAPDPPKFC